MGAHEFLFLLANTVHTKKNHVNCFAYRQCLKFLGWPSWGVLFIHAMVITLSRIKKNEFYFVVAAEHVTSPI